MKEAVGRSILKTFDRKMRGQKNKTGGIGSRKGESTKCMKRANVKAILTQRCQDTNSFGEIIRGRLGRVYDAAALKRLQRRSV
jgi:hypothetical protein